MTQYRKKPVVIEAFQFNPEGKMYPEWDDYSPVRRTSYIEIHKILGTTGCSKSAPYWNWDRLGIVETLEGPHVAEPGDFIIRGIKGEFYPCKPDIFEKTYDKVENEDSEPVSHGTPCDFSVDNPDRVQPLNQ